MASAAPLMQLASARCALLVAPAAHANPNNNKTAHFPLQSTEIPQKYETYPCRQRELELEAAEEAELAARVEAAVQVCARPLLLLLPRRRRRRGRRRRVEVAPDTAQFGVDLCADLCAAHGRPRCCAARRRKRPLLFRSLLSQARLAEAVESPEFAARVAARLKEERARLEERVSAPLVGSPSLLSLGASPILCLQPALVRSARACHGLPSALTRQGRAAPPLLFAGEPAAGAGASAAAGAQAAGGCGAAAAGGRDGAHSGGEQAQGGRWVLGAGGQRVPGNW